LEAAFERERQFTADASHELRTPLTTIRTILEMTRIKPRTTEDYEQALDDIYEETHRLQSLAENLLVLAREDSQHIQFAQTVDLAALSHNVVGAMRPFTQAKGLAFAVTIEDALLVSGDSEMLRRLFTNLIDNAIKYTDQGRISLHAHRSHDARITISIADTGVGIPADQLPHVFDRFYRVDAARSTPGTGLGLTIARRIVQKHQGTIDLQSTVDKGTTVTVVLPVGSGERLDM
jgi:signal transduction histidine kinase